MAAQSINLSTVTLFYGTFSEITALGAGTAKVGDIGFTTDGPTHSELTYGATGWQYTRKTKDGSAYVHVSNSLIAHWGAGAGTSGLPAASALDDFTIGVDNGGISTATVYHVINGAWVDTGATVANIYGA